jgi:hypothetical protein
VRARIAMLHNHRKLDNNTDPTRPTLRRSPGSGNGPVDSGTGTDDDRPTLKRRDGGAGTGSTGNGNGNGNQQQLQ